MRRYTKGGWINRLPAPPSRTLAIKTFQEATVDERPQCRRTLRTKPALSQATAAGIRRTRHLDVAGRAVALSPTWDSRLRPQAAPVRPPLNNCGTGRLR